MRKNMVDVNMKMKFSIGKYFQVFNRDCSGYGGLAKFITIDQSVAFAGEGYNFSFTDAVFHTVCNAPTLYRVNERQQ
jgi:hypothetical protein